MIALRLSPEAQNVLRSFATQLLGLLDGEGDSEVLKRLFPPAYGGEYAELEADYHRLMGDDLRARHREAAETLLATLDATEIDEATAHAWVRALNELRLVLGTILDVSEDDYDERVDPSDPRAASWSVYHFLNALQDELVDELSAGL